MIRGVGAVPISHHVIQDAYPQAVLFAGDVETLSPGNHEKVTGNVNENPRVIK